MTIDRPATRTTEIAYARPEDLAVVREFVRTAAGALGLPRPRAEMLAVAVSELATNTLQHTREGGRVRIWAQEKRLCCEVTDRGAPPPFGRAMPPATEPRGRGLAIVERVCDEVSVESGPDGTTVRICLFL
jgi:serine/threonine-protein kinase RsbW